MNTNTKYLISLSLITTFVAAQALAQQIKPDETKRIELNQAYGKLPLSFEANQGQTDPQVKFLSRGNGYSLFLTPTEAVAGNGIPCAKIRASKKSWLVRSQKLFTSSTLGAEGIRSIFVRSFPLELFRSVVPVSRIARRS